MIWINPKDIDHGLYLNIDNIKEVYDEYATTAEYDLEKDVLKTVHTIQCIIKLNDGFTYVLEREKTSQIVYIIEKKRRERRE